MLTVAHPSENICVRTRRGRGGRGGGGGGGGGGGAGLRQKFARGVQFLGSVVNVKPVKACFDVYLQVLVLK